MTPSDLQETLRLHVLWLLGDSVGKRADLQDANLRGANLQGADLQDANLRGANLRGACGNMREIKSAQFDKWAVTWTADTLQIGCQRHPIALWKKADPRWIAAMDSTAPDWWAKFGPLVLQMIDLSPATPTDHKEILTC